MDETVSSNRTYIPAMHDISTLTAKYSRYYPYDQNMSITTFILILIYIICYIISR